MGWAGGWGLSCDSRHRGWSGWAGVAEFAEPADGDLDGLGERVGVLVPGPGEEVFGAEGGRRCFQEGLPAGRVLAALGVLNTALMATRERVHDLGVSKAVG